MSDLSILPQEFSEGSVLQVARRLLGQRLVREWSGERLGGRIVEVEAYGGRWDPSAHTFRGPTPRCATMFGPVHHAYVYFTYGNHHCVNLVAGSRADACAVLIRAIEPEFGVETMRRLRGRNRSSQDQNAWQSGRRDRELANGPGKLTMALDVDGRLDGAPLDGSGPLWLAQGPRVRRVHWTPRIGLGRNPAASWCWRVVDVASTGVTPIPRSWPRHARPDPTLAGMRKLGHGDARFDARRNAGRL